MHEALQFLGSLSNPNTLFIFNSHADWDHIWGNCAFPDSIIAAHTTCRERMKETGLSDLSRYHTHTRGSVRILLPNLTFDHLLCLEEDNVEFWYAPGHTIDSSVCFDRLGQILYVGDLIEDPIPYIHYDRIDVYIKTLESLLTSPAHILVSAHSGIVSRERIMSNIAYLNALKEEAPIDTSTLGSYTKVHQANLNTLVMFRYEAMVRDILKEQYAPEVFWSLIPEPETIDQKSVEQIMQSYLKMIQKENSRELIHDRL